MTRYVIGRNFQIAGDQTLYYGDVAPDDVVTWSNLQVLIASHYIYPVPDDGSEFWLPAHLYSHVQNIQIVKGIISEGDPPDMEINWTKPAAVVRQEELLEMEAETRETNHRVAEVRARQSHARFQATQLSPRPIELPPEKIFVDSKKGEAEDIAEVDTGVDHLVPPAEVEHDEGDDAVETLSAEEDDANTVNENVYSRSDLQELARGWNADHEDDQIALNTNRSTLERALRDRGMV